MVVACAPPGVGSEGREQCWGAGEAHLKNVQPQPLQTPPSAPLVPDWGGAELLHGGGGVPLPRTPTLWKGNVLSLGANIFSPCDPPTRPRLFSSGQCGPGIRRRSKRALAGAAPLAQQYAAQRVAFFLEVLHEGPGSRLNSRPTLALYVASGSFFNLSEFGLPSRGGMPLGLAPRVVLRS